MSSVDVMIHIRNNSTSETRILHDDLMRDPEGNPVLWGWSEGNYSCDCNRRLYFARAAKEAEDWESGCSDGQYSVNIYRASDLVCIYREFDERVL